MAPAGDVLQLCLVGPAVGAVRMDDVNKSHDRVAAMSSCDSELQIFCMQTVDAEHV